MRARLAAFAAAVVVAAGLAAPATAYLPSVCNVVGPDGTTALVSYGRSPARAARSAAAAGGRVVGRVTELGVLQVAFGTPALRDAALPVLRRSPGVRAVEAEHRYTATRKPNDPYWPYQWGLFNVGALKAWDHETGTRNPVTVAVLDTGVDLLHPDLMGRVLAGSDVANDDDDPTDDEGHGTHVAGIIAASTGNRVGVAGLSWGAKVLAVKVLDQGGGGSDCDIVLGMVRATDAGARVLNLSLGSDGAPCGLVTQQAVDYAHSHGALTVVSAGNSAKDGNPASAPANCAGVLAVGATDSRDKVASFSTHHPYVGISAPGVGVLSTYWDPETGRHTYATMSGTSMAAPYVSGIAALLLSRHPTWTPDQVADRLVRTADDRGSRGKDDYFGAGRVNAARALS